MADNVTLDSGSGGATIRGLEDGSSIIWPVGVVAYATSTGAPDVLTIPLAAALADNTANPTTLLSGSCLMNFDGSTWDRVLGNSTDGLTVNLGSNNDVTVTSGAVTATLSAVDNAVLDSIVTNTTGLAGAVSGSELQVDIVSAPTLTVDLGTNNDVTVTSGTVTANLGTVDNAVLDSIVTNTTGLAGTVSGSELQVDVVAALPAGTNAIGKLAANTGVDIGDVDVTSVIPGTGATSLGKAEDATHTTGDTGVMSLGVRLDSGASLAGTDGDYAPFQLDSSGNIRVNVAAGGGSGGTSTTDDAAFTAGSGSGTPAMGFFSTDTVNAGDVGVLAMDASRRLLCSIEVDNVGIGGGTQYTEDAAAPANPVGTAFMAQRDDALGGLTPIEGDWSHLFCDANGAFYVNVNNEATVALSAVDNAVLDQIVTNTTGLAGTVSGSELQVDIVAAIPAGTNAIGKLAANSGVDIGDVDVTSVIPGTAATNLGKAIDSAVGSTDTGIALLGCHQEDLVHLTTADGDYDVLKLDSLGQLHVNPEGHHVFSEMDDYTAFAALNNDTTTLADTTKHVLGTGAISFNKVNGAANTVFGMITDTIASVDLGDISPHDIMQMIIYVSSVADLDYAVLRLGTDSTNYNEWRVDAAALTAGTFNTVAFTIGDADHGGVTGNGWNPAAITYMAAGVAMNAESDTLSGIILDEISYHTNQHVSASINAEVSSSVSSPNVKINGYSGTVDTGSGNLSATGTLRVTVATDDANLSAALTSLQLADDVVYVDDADWTALTSKHGLVGGVYQSTPGTITDGDTGPLRVDANGHLITSQHGESIALADGVSNTANITVDEAGAFVASAGFGYQYNGTTWDRLRGDATDGLQVNLGANNDVTVTSGTVTANLGATDNAVLDQIATNTTGLAGAIAGTEVQVDIVSSTALTVDLGANNDVTVTSGSITADLGANNDIHGTVASDSADSGNPVKVGGLARTSEITNVANADRVDFVADKAGKQIVLTHANPENFVQGSASATGTSNTAVLTAAGAGVRNYVTTISVANTSATDTEVTIKDGTTTLMVLPAPTLGGAVLSLPVPLVGTANTAINFASSDAATTIYVTCVGYTGA